MKEIIYQDYPVITVCRADLESYIKNVEVLTDDDMREIASKLADALFDTAYWDCLEVIATEIIPRQNERIELL